MAEPEQMTQWGHKPMSGHPDSDKYISSHRSPRGETRKVRHTSGIKEETHFGSNAGIWLNAELRQRETTTQLDDQDPATLYYLGRVIRLDDVVEVYVDQKPNGEIKHWTVIESRDYETMEQIYDIELDTRDRFPFADLDFRVTVYTDDGPSAAHRSMKIYKAE